MRLTNSPQIKLAKIKIIQVILLALAVVTLLSGCSLSAKASAPIDASIALDQGDIFMCSDVLLEGPSADPQRPWKKVQTALCSQAHAMLVVNPEYLFHSDITTASINADTVRIVVNTLTQLIQENQTLANVVRNLEWHVQGVNHQGSAFQGAQPSSLPTESAISLLRTAISATNRPDSLIIDVAVLGGSAQESLLLCNTLVKTYQASILEHQLSHYSNMSAWIDEQISEALGAIDNYQRRSSPGERANFEFELLERRYENLADLKYKTALEKLALPSPVTDGGCFLSRARSD